MLAKPHERCRDGRMETRESHRSTEGGHAWKANGACNDTGDWEARSTYGGWKRGACRWVKRVLAKVQETGSKGHRDMRMEAGGAAATPR